MESKLTKEIYDKHPKVVEKIETYIKSITIDDDVPGYIYEIAQDTIICIYDTDRINYFALPFNLLYALLEDFFMDNKIIISIDYNRNNDKLWDYLIQDIKRPYASINGFKDKNESKYQAIIKSCEILNNRG